jgi:uncharacterized protein (TIGR02271 family)
MKNDSRNLEQYVDHDVTDQTGNKIGKLTCLWSDSNGEPAYLGVQTTWLFGKTHVVPAQRAQVNETSRTIRLPYTSEKVKGAPAYDPAAEIDASTEFELRSYYNIENIGRQQAASTAQQPRSSQESANVRLHEEQVKVGKRQVEGAGVRLRKIIRTETVNQPVELQHEEIVVERVPVSGQAQPGPKDFQQEDIFIPLRREEAVIEKESRVREEVRISKKPQTERQTISEQVRKEDIEVQRAPGASASASGPPARGKRTPRGHTGESRHRSTKAVFCLCPSEQQASTIVSQLKQSGFSRDDISVLLPDKRGTKDFAHEKNTKAPEGATTGGATGGVVGGVFGWLVGVGALAIPGLGPFIAGGPIVAALSGAAVGAGAGGLIGALVGLGIPEYEAKRYEGKLREGKILISVHSDNSDETSRGKDIFQRAGATDISATGEEKLSKAA